MMVNPCLLDPPNPRNLVPTPSLIPPLAGFVAALVLTAAPAGAQTDAGSWPAYGRDRGGERYSPLKQISRTNVRRLRAAWTYHTGEIQGERERRSFEATPLYHDGTLYLVTPLGQIIALDGETGRERWTHDVKVLRTAGFGDFTSRGVSLWRDPEAPNGAPCSLRVLAATVDARLFALDAATGRLCPEFGDSGKVILRVGLRNRPFELAEYEVTSPPAIVGSMLVVGSAVADNNRTDAASGEVRGYDARTGALRWTWDPVPQEERDPGWRTWVGERAHRTGAANAWSVIAADSVRGLVFVPTGARAPTTTAASARAKTVMPTRSSHSAPRPASSSGPFRSSTTISGITTWHRRRR